MSKGLNLPPLRRDTSLLPPCYIIRILNIINVYMSCISLAEGYHGCAFLLNIINVYMSCISLAEGYHDCVFLFTSPSPQSENVPSMTTHVVLFQGTAVIETNIAVLLLIIKYILIYSLSLFSSLYFLTISSLQEAVKYRHVPIFQRYQPAVVEEVEDS